MPSLDFAELFGKLDLEPVNSVTPMSWLFFYLVDIIKDRIPIIIYLDVQYSTVVCCLAATFNAELDFEIVVSIYVRLLITLVFLLCIDSDCTILKN